MTVLGGSPPPATNRPFVAYDQARNVIVVFSGGNGGGCGGGGDCDETYFYSN